MNTILAKVKAEKPEDDVIKQGAEILRQGGLVAFPTETVYGLGADALNPEAVAKVYKVKGRPSDNPLIWHANELEAFESLLDFSVGDHASPIVASMAKKLAGAFWPGPLTMVLSSKHGQAGTIAIRVPSHPIARALIAESGCFIAAPSANISGRPSPTKAKHVMADLAGAIEMLIDGGPTNKGLESTVIDLHTGIPTLLRPGAVTVEMIQEVISELGELVYAAESEKEDTAPLSPGMKYRHYAPNARLVLLIGTAEAVSAKIAAFTQGKAEKIGIFRTHEDTAQYVAQSLFDRLRQFDEEAVSLILAEGIEEKGIGLAVMNRLKKAAAEVIYL